MPDPASHLSFLGDQCCEYRWKGGPPSASSPSQGQSYYASLPMLSTPSPNRDWMWGMGTGCSGERDSYLLEFEEGRTFGVCLSHSFIPPNSSSVLKKQKKNKKKQKTHLFLLLFFSESLLIFDNFGGINSIFVGKDPTHLPSRY